MDVSVSPNPGPAVRIAPFALSAKNAKTKSSAFVVAAEVETVCDVLVTVEFPVLSTVVVIPCTS